VNPPRRRPAVSPRLTILPKTLGPGEVGQFQRRLRNCHLHSLTAVWRPALTLCRTPGFCRISLRCLRLSSCRLGSSTSCTFLESVSRLVDEATLMMPLRRPGVGTAISRGVPPAPCSPSPPPLAPLCDWRILILQSPGGRSPVCPPARTCRPQPWLRGNHRHAGAGVGAGDGGSPASRLPRCR